MLQENLNRYREQLDKVNDRLRDENLAKDMESVS